jgi:hypothetical protein
LRKQNLPEILYQPYIAFIHDRLLAGQFACGTNRQRS